MIVERFASAAGYLRWPPVSYTMRRGTILETIPREACGGAIRNPQEKPFTAFETVAQHESLRILQEKTDAGSRRS